MRSHMRKIPSGLYRGEIQTRFGGDRARVVLQRNDLRALRGEEPRRCFADVAEALDGDSRAVDHSAEPAHRLARDLDHTPAGRVVPT